MPRPDFTHSPMIGRLQAIFYGGGQPLEFFFAMPKRRSVAIERMAFECEWYKRRHFVLRDDKGEVFHDSAAEQVAA